MRSDHDHAVLRRVADGDETALATLYDKWGQRVHTVAYWILRDADEAEDIVEETFWQVWRTASQYNWRRAAASTWLVMIARSRALDRLRARRRKASRADALEASQSTLDGRGAAGWEQPGSQQERTELHAALSAALGELPLEQREALELAFFGGLSHAEIAGRTAQPLGTVKTRIRLAMRKLRQRLASLRDEGL
jgi:RNA polymerase sigma-70 factor (ECF subfamily)